MAGHYTRWASLDPAPRRQGDMAVPAHDQVIEESYVHERQRAAQLEGDAATRRAGLRDPGGMIGALKHS